MSSQNFKIKNGLNVNGLQVIDGVANGYFNVLRANDIIITGGGSLSTDQYARDTANSAGIYANTGITIAESSFDKANLANVLAQAAFDQANTSGNPFNQDLNTANNVTFNQIIVSSNTTSNSYKFNTSAGVSVAQGEMAWNSSDGTVDIGVGYADVVLQVGQETHYVVRNNTGSQILNGTALYCSGVTTGSGRLEVSPMIGNGSIDPVQFIGLATHNINNGVNGIATYFGYVRGIDTRGTANTALSVGDEDWQIGDKLYVHPTANGKLTKVEPQAPNTKICTAVVITRHQTVGVLFVRPTTNLVLSKLSDAQINTVTDGELLQYVSANNRWENKSSSSIIEPAFTQANTAINNAASASSYANTGITLAQAAFDQANTGGGGGSENVTANSISFFNGSQIYTGNVVISNTSANQIFDSWSSNTYGSVEYTISATAGTDLQLTKVMILFNGTTVTVMEYANTYTSPLISVDADYSSGNVNALVTALSAPLNLDFQRVSFFFRIINPYVGDLMEQSGTIDLMIETGSPVDLIV